jgi:hypothetical protein
MNDNQNNVIKQLKEANFELFYKLYFNYSPSKSKLLLLELFDFIQFSSLAYNYKVKSI